MLFLSFTIETLTLSCEPQKVSTIKNIPNDYPKIPLEKACNETTTTLEIKSKNINIP